MEPKFEVKMDEFLPLRDVVFNTLRQAILRGELKPGERLMEIQLANKLGVSRTPIREAIRKLELEGLVLMIPRKGAEVAEITEKNMLDVLEVRRALEELAVKLACERITEEEIQELKDAADAFQKILSEKDITKIAEADEAFHDVIFKSTGNDRLIQLLNSLPDAGHHDAAARQHAPRRRQGLYQRNGLRRLPDQERHAVPRCLQMHRHHGGYLHPGRQNAGRADAGRV